MIGQKGVEVFFPLSDVCYLVILILMSQKCIGVHIAPENPIGLNFCNYVSTLLVLLK